MNHFNLFSQKIYREKVCTDTPLQTFSFSSFSSVAPVTEDEYKKQPDYIQRHLPLSLINSTVQNMNATLSCKVKGLYSISIIISGYSIS